MSWFDLKIDIKSLNWLLNQFERNIEWKIILWIRKWLDILLAELKKNTPEDTKEMLKSYKIIDVVKKWDLYIWVIWNTAEHSLYVEFWVGWNIYNYHKPKWSKFYSGIWNKTFERSLINVQDKILQVIVESIW